MTVVPLSPLVHPDVSGALAAGRPVVALESTIFSHLGLPTPANREALDRCVGAVRERGAVPAVTAVLDGVPRVGLEPDEHDRVCGPARKAAERDLAVAVAAGWDYGATTVSAALALADAVGIRVFATGGIGGVHRGAETSGDVSADLDAIAHHPVVTVCAGAKAFLDLPRTLEHLETAGVPVLGWQHDWFPAFYTRSSGLRVPHRVESAAVVASVLANRARADTGVLLTVPIPAADELDPQTLDAALIGALADAEASSITGAAVTPFVLGRIGQATAGESVPANLALAERNCEVAAEVAVAIAALGEGRGHEPGPARDPSARGGDRRRLRWAGGDEGPARRPGRRHAGRRQQLPHLPAPAVPGGDGRPRRRRRRLPRPRHLPPAAQRGGPHGPGDRHRHGRAVRGGRSRRTAALRLPGGRGRGGQRRLRRAGRARACLPAQVRGRRGAAPSYHPRPLRAGGRPRPASGRGRAERRRVRRRSHRGGDGRSAQGSSSRRS